MKKNDSYNKRAFTISEAADYACVSRSTIENWLEKGLLSYEELPGSGTGLHRFVRIRKADLDEFIDRYYKKNLEISDTNQITQKKLILLPRKT